MKVFITILILFVLATFCKGETKLLPHTFTFEHSQYICTPTSNFAGFISEEILVDEQDTSEQEVFENCFFKAIPAVKFILVCSYFQVEPNNQAFQNPIQSFFIDLPPPMLS